MSEEKVEAKLDQVKGSVKEGAGKLTGDKELQTEGFIEKTVAKGKELAEDAKEFAEGAIENLKKKMK